ncbi:hypothetical protein E2C01_026226 [Portunus trituberculatus]|uniref:Uncharacterized protein n=1 Tax=Portunus trituberculatus TaxID=210409 RepID=A0A5B7EFG6_PORTR|nr:hypothetical protein [Portunus trituberculatus]
MSLKEAAVRHQHGGSRPEFCLAKVCGVRASSVTAEGVTDGRSADDGTKARCGGGAWGDEAALAR